MIPGIRRLFRLPLNDRTVEVEVADEVAFHIESRVEELVRGGESREAAHAQALREFGDVADARVELSQIDYARVRVRRRTDMIDALRQDLRLVFRNIGREPWFAIAIIVTLGLGIGVNAAMFGITDRLLFRAPPGIGSPDQVKRIYFSQMTLRSGFEQARSTSWPEYDRLRKGLTGIDGIAAYFNTDASIGRGADAASVRLAMSSASYFPTLASKPLIGRYYNESDEAQGAHVIVLGYSFWKSKFNGDNLVLGRELLLGKQKYAVIGVAPRGFNGAEYEPVDVYVPVSIYAPEMWGDDWNTNAVGFIRIIARIKPDASVAQLNAQATAIEKAAEPSFRDDKTAAVTLESVILPRAPQESELKIGQTAQIALWLSGLSLLVLVIACANVINLLLVRVNGRQRETGIRMALGVGRARLVRYLLLETATLAVLGGIGGLLIAEWGGALIRRLLLPDMDWSAGAVDGRVLAYTAILVTASSLLAVIAPAMQSLRTDLNSVVKSGARAGANRSHTRLALIALQTSLSVVLLVVAGLFVRSQLNLKHLNKGFDADHVMAVYINTGDLELTGVQVDALYREAAERIRHVPGVTGVSVAMTVPFWSSLAAPIKAEGVDSISHPKNGGPFYNSVQPSYFATAGTKITRGRVFTDADGAGARKVAIVSETMARQLWDGQDPIGKCIYLRRETDCRAVVGVAEDALHFQIEGAVMMLYLPLDQVSPTGFRSLAIRTGGDPTRVQIPIRKALLTIRKDLPFADMRVLSDLMSPQTRQWELGAVLFTAFGILALLLAALGLYSVIAYNVAQRTRELSVRMALGARTTHLVGLVVRDTGRVVILGLVVGVVGAMYAARAVATLLFHVAPWDAPVFSSVLVVLLVVGILASAVPAMRALGISPGIALKDE